MKTKLLLSSLLIAGSMLFNFTIDATGHGGSGQHEEDQDEHNGGDGHEQGDCDLDGNEELKAAICLVATTNAPEGASGVAKLEAENDEGTATATLEIKTKGLLPGIYTLSIVKKSDGSSVDLGQITVSNGSHCGDGDVDEDEDEDGDHDLNESNGDNNDKDDGDVDDDGDNHDKDDGDVETESEITLPADLDPMDIAQIILSDADGNPVLVGDLLNPTSGCTMNFKACVRVTPDAGAPDSAGTAQIVHSHKKGKEKNRFTLLASGVPANCTYSVEVNGTPAATVKSNKKGKVLVKKLQANGFGLQSVQLIDSHGTPAASAHF